jgi:hypothetical protein
MDEQLISNSIVPTVEEKVLADPEIIIPEC